MEVPVTRDLKEGVELINLDLLVSAHCELGEPPSIHLVLREEGRVLSAICIFGDLPRIDRQA